MNTFQQLESLGTYDEALDADYTCRDVAMGSSEPDGLPGDEWHAVQAKRKHMKQWPTLSAFRQELGAELPYLGEDCPTPQ